MSWWPDGVRGACLLQMAQWDYNKAIHGAGARLFCMTKNSDTSQPLVTHWSSVLIFIGAGMAVAFQIGKVPAALPTPARGAGAVIDTIQLGCRHIQCCSSFGGRVPGRFHSAHRCWSHNPDWYDIDGRCRHSGWVFTVRDIPARHTLSGRIGICNDHNICPIIDHGGRPLPAIEKPAWRFGACICHSALALCWPCPAHCWSGPIGAACGGSPQP